jgi:Cu(I)/Ag(I) efflux system membrane fusion protein
VPVESVLRTGERSLVYVQHEPGQFEPRDIEIGPRARLRGTNVEVYPVVSGLQAGEKVVRRGNFLIDSQSRIGSGSSGYSGALEGEGE